MDEEQPVSRISRRKALKRIGAGAAVAWTAPVLSSLRSPAFASTSPDRCTWSCDPFVELSCGRCASGPFCRCNKTTEGDVFCWDGCTPCGTTPTCTSSSTCPAGYRCIPDNCCAATICLPPCPADPGAATVTATGPLAGRP